MTRVNDILVVSQENLDICTTEDKNLFSIHAGATFSLATVCLDFHQIQIKGTGQPT